MKKLSIVVVAVLGLSGCVAVPYGGYYGGGPAYGPAVYAPAVSVGVGYGYGGRGYYGGGGYYGRGRW